ncbi:hypothetical protein [Lysobacter gummosus]
MAASPSKTHSPRRRSRRRASSKNAPTGLPVARNSAALLPNWIA